MRKTRDLLLLAVLVPGVVGCTYFSSAAKQAHYSRQQELSPTQTVQKHLLGSDSFLVYGKIEPAGGTKNDPVAVVALSSLYYENEVVGINHSCRVGSYYGLNLPPGSYQLLVVSDRNRDGFYDETEVIGERLLSLDSDALAEKVIAGVDIDLQVPFPSHVNTSLHLPVKKLGVSTESVFYPRGSVRSLDDDIFSARMATLGTYDPAAFLEVAPTMFYALEEEAGYKVPVLFVHGSNGSARDFKDIVSGLDRTLYEPWFFYYPSGVSMEKLSQIFYEIFLSGEVISLGDMPLVIVAHSMGGLVVRDALNRCAGTKGETVTRRLITIASPMAGHPNARLSAKGPVPVPSWRDVVPGSEFMVRLRRKDLPRGLEYHLIYAYRNPSTFKFGENSDGVVPLSSQLCTDAQEESTAQYGFDDTHTGILGNKAAISMIINIINEVKSPHSVSHLAELAKGGYRLYSAENYSILGRYWIEKAGYWLEALGSGAILPEAVRQPFLPEQTHFVQVCRGEKEPSNDVEKDWLRFLKNQPERRPLEQTRIQDGEFAVQGVGQGR